MGTNQQRDADLDRLLRARLRQESAEAPGPCPDPGLLAALVEGGVSSDERAACETHLATCSRCQETLASMDLDGHVLPADVRAAEGPEKRPWLWRGHLHWLIPVGAASLLVIYLATKPAIAPYFPPGRPEPMQVAEMRPSELSPAGTAATADRPLREPAPGSDASAAVPAPPAATPARAQERAATSFAAAPAARAPEKDEQPVVGNVAVRTAQDVDASKRAAEPAAAAPQLAAATAPSPAVAPEAPIPPAGAGAGGGVAVPVAAKDASSERRAELQRKAVVSEVTMQTAAATFVVAFAPGRIVQWRVGAGGAIWRSGDEGRTWFPQKSGVKTALLGASAPSITTCWTVGASGTVLLTDDGERWERRPFPEKADLVGVEARSPHEATVTTRDGRRFVTADRGATWTLQRQHP